jgi:hypothetical protein
MHDSASSPSRAARSARRSWDWTGGVEGNAHLTALIGLVLLVLLFAEGLTILSVRRLFTIHAFVGLLLVPPVLLKLASTGYRFVRYYTGSPTYRATGPPRPIPRIIAPILVACTIGLFGTGIVLLFVGPSGGETWKSLHTLFFLVWFGVMAVHVLAYLGRARRLALADLGMQGDRGTSTLTAGRMTRQGLLVGSLLLGVTLAIVLIPWDASWIHVLTRIRPDR